MQEEPPPKKKKEIKTHSYGPPHSSMPSDRQKYDYTHIMTIIWWNYGTRSQLPNYSQLSWERPCVIISKLAFNSTTVIIPPLQKNHYFETTDYISLSRALNSSLAIFSYLTKKKKKKCWTHWMSRSFVLIVISVAHGGEWWRRNLSLHPVNTHLKPLIFKRNR